MAAADAAAPFLVLRVRRASLVEDALESLAGNTPLSLLKPLRVVFVGEEGIDEGGLRKELFQLLIEALFTGGYGLFVWNEEVFGPVLCIRSFETEAEALEIANDSKYGLSASVYMVVRMQFFSQKIQFFSEIFR